LQELYIGIDLAWGENNSSGFCVLTPVDGKLKILNIKLLQNIESIVTEIVKYKNRKIYIGIDAPLLIPNETGNRDVEKNFNKDFAKNKIAMFPVSRKLLRKEKQLFRGEVLYQKLQDLGFMASFDNDKVVFEVYPHSTIAVCFNQNNILEYKRKKGRSIEYIKQQLEVYKKYLLSVIKDHDLLQNKISDLRTKQLKDYEDCLDAITSAFTLYYCRYNKSKIYKCETKEIFITPI